MKHATPTSRYSDAPRGKRWIARRLGSFVLIVVTVFSLGACHTAPQAKAPATAPRDQVNNEGYSLLYDLLVKQQGVDKALWLRTVEPDFAKLIKEIAQASNEGRKQLEAYAQNDPALNIKLQPLPEVERRARAAIEATESGALMASQGAVFQRRLLLTQASSMQYASHLARVLSARETQEVRKSYLVDLAKQLDSLDSRAVNLLTVKAPNPDTQSKS